MAEKNRLIRLSDSNSTYVCPVTKSDGVFMSDGNTTLETKMNEVTSQLEQTAKQIDLDVTNARIDAFTKLEQGSTTGDVELIDGRIGANGKTYSNIGGNIRDIGNGKGIINKAINTLHLNDKIIEKEKMVSYNDIVDLFRKDIYKEGYKITPTTGAFVENSAWKVVSVEIRKNMEIKVPIGVGKNDMGCVVGENFEFLAPITHSVVSVENFDSSYAICKCNFSGLVDTYKAKYLLINYHPSFEQYYYARATYEKFIVDDTMIENISEDKIIKSKKNKNNRYLYNDNLVKTQANTNYLGVYNFEFELGKGYKPKSMDGFIRYNTHSDSTLDKAKYIYEIEFKDSECILDVGSYCFTTQWLDAQILATINRSAKTVTLKKWNGNTTINTVKTENIPFDLKLNTPYKIIIEKDTFAKLTFTIIDINSPKNKFSFSYENSTTGLYCWGVPIVRANTGLFYLKRIAYISNQSREVEIAIIGDSFTEGNAYNVDVNKRYASLIKKELGEEKVYINGMGGADIRHFIDIFNLDLTMVNAKYYYIAFGVNDSTRLTTEQFITNLQTVINWVESKGSIPILMTIPSKNNNQNIDFISVVNPQIRNMGKLYVDIAKALSSNGNGLDRDSTMLATTDTTHPNELGHEVIFERFKIDIPEIFNN